MSTKSFLLIGLFFLVSCSDATNNEENDASDQKGRLQPTVIYGEDNRLDLFQISNLQLLAVADSTVALVDKDDFRTNADGSLLIIGNTLGNRQQLCSTEPFREQVASAFCSGFLVAPDVIITAGHCISDVTDCANAKFVFGYGLKTLGADYARVGAADVVGCKSVIHTQAENSGADFAVIKLDRIVTNHAPLKIRTSGKIGNKDPLVVIGHPSGLPTKIAAGANVRENDSTGYFVSNLDTYGGNSGSAVFNANTLEVEGVLVRGENDYSFSGGCYVSNKCELDKCRGEDVTRITEALEYLGIAAPPPPPNDDDVYVAKPSLAIPDNNAKGVSSSVEVGAVPSGRKVHIKLSITHTWIGDLTITVTNPDGKTVVLRKKSGGNTDNIVGIVGDTIPSLESLTPLSSTAKTGKWTLSVSDQAVVDEGVLNEWAVVFKN